MSEKSLGYTHHAAYTMAGLTGAGALYGGLVSGSKMSLLSGGLICLGYIASGSYAQQGEYLLSNQLGALSGAVLTAGMGMRYLGTKAAMPLIMSTAGMSKVRSITILDLEKLQIRAASTAFHAYHWSKIRPIKLADLNPSKK